jgi:hypothetical protein
LTNPPRSKEREAAYRTITNPKHVMAMMSRVFRRTVIGPAPSRHAFEVSVFSMGLLSQIQCKTVPNKDEKISP